MWDIAALASAFAVAFVSISYAICANRDKHEMFVMMEDTYRRNEILEGRIELTQKLIFQAQDALEENEETR